ncbi:MAG: gliding motility protein GldN [Bacteroidales bacterium]|jgi:gliding motility associated protien GldN|nr:gliding motility protein GldN [Bacteroidales bacterium]
MKTLFVSILILFGVATFVHGQQVFDTPPDRVWDKDHYVERVAVPYPHLRRADVFYAHRVWRVIDLREKINHPLYYPHVETNGRINFVSVILKGVEEGSIRAFNAVTDDFTVPLSQEEIENALVVADSTPRFDPFTGEQLPDTVIIMPLDVSSFTKIRLKEEWFFDMQRSVIECRILGVCPIRDEYDDEGNLKGFRPLFWIYFPEARNIFVKHEVYNRYNDGQRLTFDDFFFRRMFNSYVIKESNVYDRYISEIYTGMDALLESERLEEQRVLFEHDLWEY